MAFFSLHLQFHEKMENMVIGLEFCFCLCCQGKREFCLCEKRGHVSKSLRTPVINLIKTLNTTFKVIYQGNIFVSEPVGEEDEQLT